MAALTPPFLLLVCECSDTHAYSLCFSMYEIYNETVRDLMNPDGDLGKFKALDIRRGPEGTFVEGLTKKVTSQAADIEGFVATGFSRRAVGSTTMNERSSRSHMVVMVEVTSTEVIGGKVSKSKLFLIDLAGSERYNAFEKAPDRARESQVCVVAIAPVVARFTTLGFSMELGGRVGVRVPALSTFPVVGCCHSGLSTIIAVSTMWSSRLCALSCHLVVR